MQEVLSSLGLWPLFLLAMVTRRRLKRILARTQANGCAQAARDALVHVRRLKRYLCTQVFAECFTSAPLGSSGGSGVLSFASQSATSSSSSAAAEQLLNSDGSSTPAKRAREGQRSPVGDVAASDMQVDEQQHLTSLFSLTRPGLASIGRNGTAASVPLSRLGASRFLELYFTRKFRSLYDLLSEEFTLPTSSSSVVPPQRCRYKCSELKIWKIRRAL